MSESKVYTVIGLMSGTSVDGVDAAVIRTDGHEFVEPLDAVSVAYPDEIRRKIKACFGKRNPREDRVAEAERLLTYRHIDAINSVIEEAGISPNDVDLIGFHGQTITHIPKERVSIQIGNAYLMAQETGIDVVSNFRDADIAAGGEGAPLMPIYHRARLASENIKRPVSILNIGGVSNISWIGPADDDLIAFDTGPGNALIDDFVLTHVGRNYDDQGKLAKTGQVNQSILEHWMALPYFSVPYPKSLDRNDWDISALTYGSISDAVATLTAFTVSAIREGVRQLPEAPKAYYVTGGGRHNVYMMESLRNALDAPVGSVDVFGWDGDALEAEGFGYLAVRSILGLPLTYPRTTGVKEPLTGGQFYKALDTASVI